MPDKNIKLLENYPLIAYSIAIAKLSGITRVIVSTDSKEYAEISIKFGAEVPFVRPKEISSDTSTDYEWATHAMQWFKNNEESLYISPSVLPICPKQAYHPYLPIF